MDNIDKETLGSIVIKDKMVKIQDRPFFKGISSRTIGEQDKDEDKVPCFSSQRWILCYMLFSANFIAYAHRVNLSLAIVCMVRLPQLDNRSMHGQMNNITLRPAKIVVESNYSLSPPPDTDESESSPCTEIISEAEKEYEVNQTIEALSFS
ncbi:hypothetical protein CHS0354_029230 [Potamilus streckersoni]|uniref:Uncharacterized protein n=1 Tax=Potamilus streckersoni TaxID=2493646 RepID=A0AAE0W1T7_9BIVA|nr:hypothetical protein CHS0354_029230 [Potamilus streckersoni]